ncbi:MAG: acyl-CoA dehydrogenase [Alphaproteobacteria bacterium]|nr:acyl-CoA dehydrogenase [Alphaproteobacteria bacterium]
MDYAPWIGRTAAVTDTLHVGPAVRLAAVLDRDDPEPRPGDPLPDGWQWLYFLAAVRAGALTADGRGTRGDLLPLFAGLRRMWAGGRFAIRRSLAHGETITRTTTVAAIDEKAGRTGQLVIARLEHRYGDALVEDQHLVFRAPESGAARSEPPPASPAWRRTITPDPVLLFRFSALTFNAHRIHYDAPYATSAEGYPALVVHGPLTALLLLDLLRRHDPRPIRRFDYRATRPLYVDRPMSLNGAPLDATKILLWAEDDGGTVAMWAEATFA